MILFNSFRLKLLAVAGAVTAFTMYSCRTHYSLPEREYTRKNGPLTIEHGRNLVYNLCGECHFDAALNILSGRKINELPKALGTIYSANLTHYGTTGIVNSYTDAQLACLIKTGIKSDGRFIPYMIRPTLSDIDVNDIICFLRSDDLALSPAQMPGKTSLSLLGKIASHTQKPQPYVTGIKNPEPDNAVENGRYLVDILGCYHCHSKNILGLNYQQPEQSKGYMRGGMKFRNTEGSKIRSPWLLSDKSALSEKYSNEQFRRVMQSGITPHGSRLDFPMPIFKYLTDKQCDDIYTYLNACRVRKKNNKCT